MRRPGLEVLLLDPARDLEHRALDPFGVVGLGLEPHPLVGEHVPVAADPRVDLPRLAGAEPVERQLHVAAQLAARAGVAGLVVDQLVSTVGAAVDAVDATPELVRADRKGEVPLQPHGCESERLLRST